MSTIRINPRNGALACLAVAAAVAPLCLGALLGCRPGASFMAERVWGEEPKPDPKPKLAGPVIRIAARSDEASPQVIEDTVTTPIEQQLAGLEGMETFESISRDGGVTISVCFRPGTDRDAALAGVKKRVALATPALPDLVKRRELDTSIGGSPLPAAVAGPEQP